jgi:hypothetical protein
MLHRIERVPARVVSVVFVVIAGSVALPLFASEFIPALREGHYIIR